MCFPDQVEPIKDDHDGADDDIEDSAVEEDAEDDKHQKRGEQDEDATHYIKLVVDTFVWDIGFGGACIECEANHYSENHDPSKPNVVGTLRGGIGKVYHLAESTKHQTHAEDIKC